jgi:hypothetical protein
MGTNLNQETPMSFEERRWKGDLAPSFDDKMITSMQRLHGIDLQERIRGNAF